VENDGLVFEPESVTAEEIREEEVYKGVRVKLVPRLGNARIHLQVDLGFGDAVTPAPETVELPTLLDDLPEPKLEGYPRETAVAEKYEAMVQLGEINSRMKDFYDIWRLAKLFTFDGPSLSKAVRETFDRRDTKLPKDQPVALTPEFANRNGKSRQWSHFVDDLRPGFDDPGLEAAISTISKFLWPVSCAARTNDHFDRTWNPDEGWKNHES
jgi:hypothetical protein